MLRSWKKCWIYRLWTVENSQWSQNDFNHCLTGWNSFQRSYIDVQAEEREFQHRCHVRVWSKWRHVLSLFWLTVTLPHRKRSETTYLRDRQCKKNLQVLVQEISSWNLSDAWRQNRITTTTTRTAILLNFTNTSWLQEFSMYWFKLSS